VRADDGGKYNPSALRCQISRAVEGRDLSPRRTLARRNEKNEQLTLGETDAAQRWLRKPGRALNNIVPLDLLVSETGARLVEDELIRPPRLSACSGFRPLIHTR
jgi:uncharacterized protein (DUF2384 family)